MKSGFVKYLVGFTFVALMVGAGLAQGQKVKKIQFYVDGKVGDAVVKKGTYQVVFPENEQGVIELRNGKNIITVNATRKDIAEISPADRMTYTDNGDGTRTLATISPKGEKFLYHVEGGVVASKAKEKSTKPGSQN